MKLWSDSFEDGKPIPTRCAFGKQDPASHVALSENLNPHLAWSELPPGTRSLAIACLDPDVPSRPDDVNQEGRTVPADLPRVNFTHWLLVNLPADAAPIAEGEFSRGVTARGKPGPEAPRGTLQGVNDYTGWFAGDADMEGSYHGYDGPCPPWNDSIVHHYHFKLYALDVDSVELKGSFSLDDFRHAIEGHVLAEAELVGTYSLNPEVAV